MLKIVRPAVRLAAFAVVAAALTFVASCSESGSAAPSGPVTEASASSGPSPAGVETAAEITAACPFVETSQVDEAFSVSGAAGTEVPPQTLANGGQAFVCSFAAGGEETAALVATVYEGNQITPDQMIQSIMDQKIGAEQVDGIGEGAVYYAESDGTATFSAVKILDGTPVMLTVSGPATADKDRVGVLVSHAVDKLL